MDANISLSFEDKDSYLMVMVAGDWTTEGVALAIKEIADAANQRGCYRMLVDARELAAPKSELYRFLAGEEIAHLWRGLKAAILYPEEIINKFMENTAVNRGAVVIVLSDLDEAMSWLMHDTV